MVKVLAKISRFDAQRCPVAIGFSSLSKRLYSHFSSLPSCFNKDLVLTGEAVHSTAYINARDLVLTEKVNANCSCIM